MNRTLESALRSKYNFRKQCSRRKRTSCLLRAIYFVVKCWLKIAAITNLQHAIAVCDRCRCLTYKSGERCFRPRAQRKQMCVAGARGQDWCRNTLPQGLKALGDDVAKLYCLPLLLQLFEIPRGHIVIDQMRCQKQTAAVVI